jgi:hypothetical protein
LTAPHSGNSRGADVRAEQPPDDDLTTAAVPAEPRVITAPPARPRRLVGAVVDALALGGLLVTVALFLVAVHMALDIAEAMRRAVGSSPPADGVDWYLVAITAVLVAVPAAGLLAARRLVRRRFDRRLQERLGDRSTARRFSRRGRLDRRTWLAELLETPHWTPFAERWRADGLLPPTAASWSGADYRDAAALVRAELDLRVGAVALATGTAVAVAPRRVGDAVAIVAGSAELQIEVLATLGLRPTTGAWLHVARAAATGVLASTYVDAEERFELQLLIRAAALGMDSGGNLMEDAGDTIHEALGEAADRGGAITGAVAAVAGTTMGITGNVIRQVSDFVAVVGDEVAEGVIVAAVLHYHGMALVADALGEDAAHRAELAPRLGDVPQSLKEAGIALARRRTAALRRLLRRRIVQAARRAPSSLRGRVTRRARPQDDPGA